MLARLREMAAGLNTLLEAPEAASPAWLQDELHRRYLAPVLALALSAYSAVVLMLYCKRKPRA